MIRTFVWRNNDEFGAGWVPTWIPGFNSVWGRAMAHDIMEHRPNDDGTIESEIMAFGAMQWTRGRAFSIKPSDLGAELGDLIEHAITSDGALKEPPPTKPIDSEPEMEEAMKEISEVVPHAYVNDAKYVFGKSQWDLAIPPIIKRSKIIGRQTLGWLRLGARCAMRRYRGISPYTLYECFLALEQHEQLKDRVEGRHEDDTVLVVKVLPERCRIDVHIHEPWDFAARSAIERFRRINQG